MIKDLLYPALLGTDFLKYHKAKIDFEKNVLQIGEFQSEFETPVWNNQELAQLESSVDVLLEPNSISLLRSDLTGLDPREGINRPDSLLIAPLVGSNILAGEVLTSYSVINPYMENFVVEVMNISKKPVHIRKGCPLARVEGVDPIIASTEVVRDLEKVPSDFVAKEPEGYLETTGQKLNGDEDKDAPEPGHSGLRHHDYRRATGEKGWTPRGILTKNVLNIFDMMRSQGWREIVGKK